MKKLDIKCLKDIERYCDTVPVSEVFGDEAMKLMSDLIDLWREANQYGLIIRVNVQDLWGEQIAVTVYPSVRKHQWSF